MPMAVEGGVAGGGARAAPRRARATWWPRRAVADAAQAADKVTTVTAAAPPPTVELRTDFSETAFLQPQLLTGADGSAAIEFEVPDSVTSWSVWVHALTEDLRSGSAQRETRSVKELMVRPYLPRFLREGDQAELRGGGQQRLGEAAQRRGAPRNRVDPTTSATWRRSSACRRARRCAASRVEPGGGATVTFPLAAPRASGRRRSRSRRGPATSPTASCGRCRSCRRASTSRSRASRRCAAPSAGCSSSPTSSAHDPTRDQRAAGGDGRRPALLHRARALPYLVDYPYECTEQTLNRFLSTGIVGSLFDQYPAVAQDGGRARQARDPLRDLGRRAIPTGRWRSRRRRGCSQRAAATEAGADAASRCSIPRSSRAQRDAALAKLREAQLPTGAFPWFPGGPPSAYMTLYILYGFAKARGVRGRGAARRGRARLELPRGALPRRVAEAKWGRRTAAARVPDLPQLRRLGLSRSRPGWATRCRSDERQPHPRLELRALEEALAVPEGAAGADAAPHGPAAGRAAGVRERHGLGEDDARRGHLLGARGPRLALVQRHHRDARLRAAHAARARAPGPAPRRPGAVAVPQQEAQPLEVDARHGRGALLAGPVPGAREAARGARGGDGARWAGRRRASSSSPTATPGKQQPDRDPGRARGRRRAAKSGGGEGDHGHPLRLRHLALLDRGAAGAGARRPLRRRAALLPARPARRRDGARAAGRRRALAPGDEVEVQLSLRSRAAGRVRPPARPAAGGARAGARDLGLQLGPGARSATRRSATAAPTSSSSGCRRASTRSSTACAPTSPAPSASAPPRCSRCTRPSSPPIRRGTWCSVAGESAR